jgi:hypothetical protein
MLPDYASLVDFVRQWVAKNGVNADGVRLTDKGENVVMLLLGSTDGAADEPPVEEKGRPVSAVVVDIMEVIEAAKKPLTQYGVCAALAKAGKEWSHRTVAGYLAAMVRDGVLVNPEGSTPRGYRLPD